MMNAKYHTDEIAHHLRQVKKLADKSETKAKITTEKNVKLQQQLEQFMKYSERLEKQIEICMRSLSTYGEHPIIEGQVKRLVEFGEKLKK